MKFSFCNSQTKYITKWRENSLDHPLPGGDAGHDDAPGSRGGHSLEGSPPELLKELLLLPLLKAGYGALLPRGGRGATGAQLEGTGGLHRCSWVSNVALKHTMVPQ